jgi:nitroreductase
MTAPRRRLELLAAIRARRSIRGYLPDPVPHRVVAAVIKAALRAPSAMNTQPWRFTVLNGTLLETVRRRNTELLDAKAPPRPDYPAPRFSGRYRNRQQTVFARLLDSIGIDPADTTARHRWICHGFRFFEAPVVVLVHFDATLDPVRSHFDIGAVSENIALAALAYGLGSCLCLQAVSYPDMVRDTVGLPPTDRIALGIALGYPDPEHPANQFRSPRLQLRSVTRWTDRSSHDGAKGWR